MKRKNVFWGLLFLLGAFAVLAGRLGVFRGVGFWSVLFSIGLLGVLVNGIIHRSWGTILFSAAFLAIVNSSLLGIEKLVPWDNRAEYTVPLQAPPRALYLCQGK